MGTDDIKKQGMDKAKEEMDERLDTSDGQQEKDQLSGQQGE